MLFLLFTGRHYLDNTDQIVLTHSYNFTPNILQGHVAHREDKQKQGSGVVPINYVSFTEAIILDTQVLPKYSWTETYICLHIGKTK